MCAGVSWVPTVRVGPTARVGPTFFPEAFSMAWTICRTE